MGLDERAQLACLEAASVALCNPRKIEGRRSDVGATGRTVSAPFCAVAARAEVEIISVRELRLFAFTFARLSDCSRREQDGEPGNNPHRFHCSLSDQRRKGEWKRDGAFHRPSVQ